MLTLKTSGALMVLTAVGFGLPAPFVAAVLLRRGALPSFFGLFPMYGGPLFARVSPKTFVVALGLFAALCALETYAGVRLWHGERAGALLTLALLPVEAVFWLAFALPIPPALAVVRVALLVFGWPALRG